MSFRIEEKLKIHPDRMPVFLNWLEEVGAVILHPRRRVVSVYLDNDRLAMFHDSEEGVLPRKKLRFRRYEPLGKPATDWNLECKISAVEGRFKTSAPVGGSPYATGLRLADGLYGTCRPRVEVSYLRSYFAIGEVRITIDRDLAYRSVAPPFRAVRQIRDHDVVIEVKTASEFPADLLTEIFPWARSRFSKYCRAVEATLLHGNQRCA